MVNTSLIMGQSLLTLAYWLPLFVYMRYSRSVLLVRSVPPETPSIKSSMSSFVFRYTINSELSRHCNLGHGRSKNYRLRMSSVVGSIFYNFFFGDGSI